MSTSKYSLLKSCFLSAAVLAAAGISVPMQAQQGPSVRVGGTKLTGYPSDWTHRHVVFSPVQTEEEALKNGTYANWQKVVNSPRYVLQQMKNHGSVQGPAQTDAEYVKNFGRQPAHSGPSTKPGFERDWSEALGGPGLAAGHYPAKYGFDTTQATCSDYVVFPTGASSSTTQATVVAFSSIYSGCSASPTVYWAYNTGAGYTATTSPVLAPDGSQVAYVQSNGTAAYLVLLKMAASGHTVATPVAPLVATTGAAYRACSAPCYIAYSLGGADTNSAPFFDYSTNVLYVGDDAGNVHEVTGAFFGNAIPAFDPTNWPVNVINATYEATASEKLLFSPVVDSGTSGLLFVTTSGGYLHSLNPATPTTAAKITGQLEHNSLNQFDSPVVDSTNEYVYTFTGYSGDTGGPSYINRFAAGTALATGNYGTGLSFKNNGATNPTTSRMFAGSFDNNYYNTYTSGHLYVCENGELWQVDTTAAFTTTPVVYDQAVSTVGVASTCSPVTEFLGTSAATTLTATITGTAATTVHVALGTGIATNDYIQVDSEIMKVTGGAGTTSLTVTAANRGLDGTTKATHLTTGVPVQDVQDWLFTSVESLGTATGCTGACIYNYNVIAGAASGTATAGFAAAGGTSGIVIDSSSLQLGGDQEIYYTPLSGTTAVQVSQAALQ